jgi:hypothetical protein
MAAAVITVLGARPALAQSALPADFSGFAAIQPAEPPADQAPAISLVSHDTPELPQTAPGFITPRFAGLDFTGQQTPIAPGTQANIRQGFGVAFLIGPMFDKFSSDDETTFENQTGLQLTLLLGGNFSGFFGVGTEITLLRRTLDDETKVNALQIPLLFYLNGGCHRINCFNFHVIFGPAIDFNLSDDGDEGFIDRIGSYRVSIIVGGMVEVARFMFQVRYVQGIRAINREFDQFSEIKTKTFVLLFGIRLN